MQKWEYCTISGIRHRVGDKDEKSFLVASYLYRFTDSGLGMEKLAAPKGTASQNYVAATIARMGDDGWELVGIGTGYNQFGDIPHDVLYFKRPKL